MEKKIKKFFDTKNVLKKRRKGSLNEIKTFKESEKKLLLPVP